MAGYKLFSFDKIPSTQTYAHELIMSGRASDHMAVVAMAQSAGRGRYRRPWVSHHGNLYVSFIYNAPDRDPRLSYAVAVAVAETLLAFGVRPMIKWPNDILIDGRKVAGILIEYLQNFVVIGIGINIKTNPTVEKYETARIDKYTDARATDVLAKLMQNMDAWIGADFGRVRVRWTELATGINAIVKYRGSDAQMCGINDDGALVLRRGTERMLIYGDEITM